MEDYRNADRYLRAKEKVTAMKGFYSHLAVYLIMVPIFIWLNYMSTSFPWAIFPIVGWGMGVCGHAFETFGWNPFLGKDWEQRKIREFMEEESNNNMFL